MSIMRILRLLIVVAALGGPAMPVVNMHGIGPATVYANDSQGDDDTQGDQDPDDDDQP